MSMVKRSVMTLYSGAADIHSHRVRIVLAEKGVSVDILNINVDEPPEDLVSLNPYNSVPTLVDRELVLYNANIIMEYLDERFPHPPLLPVYPVARAKNRLMVHRIERDWYSLADIIENGKGAAVEKARVELADNLKSLAPVFGEMPYFLSEEFSLVDCTIGPLLWRLPHLGIELPPQAKAVNAYAQRLFKREAFKASLTEVEREMREKNVA
jgi:RNA polymerase-associated protein